MNKKLRVVFMAIFMCLVYLGVTNVTAQNDETNNESAVKTTITNTNNNVKINEDNVSDDKDASENTKTVNTGEENKKSNKSLAAAEAGAVYFESAGISSVITGTAAMDDNDNPGYDSSDSNDIVRSFDTVVYPLVINLASSDGKNYKNIKVKVTGNVENGISSDGRILNAVFDSAFNGAYDLDNKTSTMEYVINGAKTGSAVAYNIPLNVQGAANGEKLTSSFTVQIMSAEDEDGNIVNLADENLTQKIDTNSVTVSSKVNLKVRIGDNQSKIKFPFDFFTNTTDNLAADIGVKGVSVAIQPIDGRSNLLGSAFPTNDVEITLDSAISQKNNTSGATTPLVIGTDTRGVTIFDYGYNDLNDELFGHLHDAKYDDHIDLSTYAAGVSTSVLPYSNYNGVPTSFGHVFNSGNITANNTADNKITIKFSDFRITDFFPTGSASAGNSAYNKDLEKIFAVARFTVVEPNEKLEENTTLQYTLSAILAEFTNSSNDTEQQDLNVVNQWSKTLYSKGALLTRSIYTDQWRYNLGNVSKSSTGNTGDAKTTLGSKIFGRSFVRINDVPSDVAELVQKWNPNESTYDSSREIVANCNTLMDGSEVTPTYKYGVAKDNDYSLVGLNAKTMNSYTWYNTVAQAQAAGTISAVTSTCEGQNGLKLATGIQNLYVPRLIVGTVGTIEDDGTPNITLTGTKVTWDKSVDNYSVLGAYDTASKYVPTTYTSTGEIKDLHTPPDSYGATLNIQPIKVSISKTSNKVSYDGGEIADWTISPVISSTQPVVDAQVTITDTLPKGVNYEAGTAKYGTTNMEPDIVQNPDGTTLLKWTISGINSTAISKITFQTSFNQLELTFNSAGISAQVNKVLISSPSDISTEAFRSFSYDFNVIKKAQLGIVKSVDRPFIDMSSTDAFTYSLEMYNNSGEDRKNITALDVLPKNGYLNTSFNGSYKIADIVATSSDTKLYYTTQDIDPESDPNALEANVVAGNNGWVEYTGGGLDVVAKAIFFTKPTLADGKSEIVKITVVPNGNKAKDFYINRAYGNSDVNSKIISNTQQTNVVNRILEGTAWYDKNYDGLINTGEAFLSNVPVTLYTVDGFGNLTKVTKNLLEEDLVDADGNSLVKTDSNGKYSFNALPALSGANKYVVGFGIKDKVDDKTYNITRSEVAGGAVELTNKAYGSQTEGNDILTNKLAPYEMPLIADMKSTTHIQSYVNLGVIPPAELDIKKEVLNDKGTDINNGIVEPSNVITYRISVENTSEYSFTDNTKVTDTLVTGLTYKAGTLKITDNDGMTTKLDDSYFDGQDLEYEIGRVQGKEKYIITFDAIIGADTGGISLENFAVINGDDPVEGETDDTSNKVIVDSEIPKLSATKIVEDASKDGSVENGESYTYTIYIRNDGEVTAKGVNIVDLLDDNEFANSTIGKATITKNDTELTKDADLVKGYEIGDMAKSEVVKIVFSVTAPKPIVLDNELIENQATITSDNHDNVLTTSEVDPEDPSKPKDPSEDPKPTTIPVKNPRLVGVKVVEDASKDGITESNETLTYTIHYTNIGNLAAKNVVIKDLLDDDEFKDATISQTSWTNGSASGEGDLQVGLEVGDIAVDGVVTITFTAKMSTVTSEGKIENQASAKGSNTDEVLTTSEIDPDNPTLPLDPDKDPVVTDIPKGNPKLSATKVVEDAGKDGIVENGEEFTYTIYIRNDGEVSAQNVKISDLLEDDEFINATLGKATITKNDVELTNDADIVKGYEIGDMAKDDIVKVVFTVMAPVPIVLDNELIENQATITSDNHEDVLTTSNVDPDDPSKPKDPEEDPKPTTIPVKNPKLVGVKVVEDANKDGITQSNETLTYTIHYTNIGNLAAKNVVIKDLLEDDEFADATISQASWTNGSARGEGDLQVGLEVGDIVVDGVVTITFTAKMAVLTPEGKIENQASAKGDNTDEVLTTSEIDPDNPTLPLDPDKEPVVTDIPKGDPKLSATKVVTDCNADGVVENGEEFTYNIYIRNDGEGPAYNVKITDLLDDVELNGAKIRDIKLYKDSVEDTNSIDIKAGYSIGTIKSKGLVMIVITMEASDPIIVDDKIISNQATVDSSNHDSIVTTSDVDPSDDTKPREDGDLEKPTTIPVKNPKLVGTKVVKDNNGNGIAESNETLSYSIHYTNTGDLTARNVIIKDTLSDDEFKNATISESKVVNGANTLYGNIKEGINVGNIEPNVTVYVTFTVKLSTLKNEGSTPGLVVNQASAKGENTKTTVTTSNCDPEDETQSLDREDQESVPTTLPKGDPYLTGTKLVKDSNGDNKFSPNEKLTYTLYFKNIGQTTAKDVKVQDSLSDAEFKGATVSQATAINGDKTYTGDIKKGFNVGDIESNKYVKVTFTVTMPKTIAKDTKTPNELVNQAFAKGTNTNTAKTTSDVDPNDPTSPRGNSSKEKETVIGGKINVPITGSNQLYIVIVLGVLSLLLGGSYLLRKYKFN